MVNLTHSETAIVSASLARDGDLAVSKIFSWRVDETFFERGKTLCWLRAKRYVVGCTERELKEAGGFEFAKNREEFRELESWRKRGAKADADRLVSRTITIAIVHFETNAFRKSESRNATVPPLLSAENFLERGWWQTNSRTLFVLKTNWLVLGGIRNASTQRNLRRNFLVEKFRYTYIKREWMCTEFPRTNDTSAKRGDST